MTENSREELRQVVAKINHGDGLDDMELRRGLDFYRSTIQALEILGPEFNLTRRELQRTLDVLEYFEENRKRNL